MKYYDMIKVGAQTSAPTSDVVDNDDAKNLTELKMSVSEIKYMLNDILAQSSKPSDSKSVKKATLTDQEVSEILTMLEEFNTKYFPDLPMAEKFSANFFWNIPYKIYKTAIKVKNKGLPVYFNPIFWFFAMCLDEPEDMIAPFAWDAVCNLTNDEQSMDMLKAATEEYINIYLGDEESTEAETPTTETTDVEIVGEENEG